MTQPAFSRRIRALEEWLGSELFDRSSQPARLTPTGEWFRTAAQDLAARVARIPGEAKAVAEAHSTTLQFAATHALSFTFMPGWLRGLEAHTSVGPVTLVSDVFARCESLLLESRVQFVMSHAHAMSSSELQSQDYPFVRIGSDVLVPVSAPDAEGRPRHPLTAATSARRCRCCTTARSRASVASCATCTGQHSTAGRPRASSRRTLHRSCERWRSTVAAWRGCRTR